MDRQKPRKSKRAFIAAGIAGVVLLAVGGLALLRPGAGAVRRVDAEAAMMGEVRRGAFEDFIPVRGQVTPAQTVFLDAVEGGRVETVLVEEGARVEAGQPLLTLSNAQLQLDVIAREAAVEEQLNNLRTLELALERNRLANARSVIDADERLLALEKRVGRQRTLTERGVLPRVQLETSEDELASERARRGAIAEARDTDERLAQSQVAQLRISNQRLNANLALARGNLDALNVRAPVAGDLTAFTVELGQSLQRGVRIGQIDSPDSFKVRARIDEFFINRISTGLTASYAEGPRNYGLRVERVYPQVSQGQFEADLIFTGAAPASLRRGQSLQMRLVLGSPEQALLAPAGAWLNETGGNWVFVSDASGRNAHRRAIRTGRRNPQFVEVLEGLQPGERIVTSSYAAFAEADRIKLTP